jgi:hypothetical protein
VRINFNSLFQSNPSLYPITKPPTRLKARGCETVTADLNVFDANARTELSTTACFYISAEMSYPPPRNFPAAAWS